MKNRPGYLAGVTSLFRRKMGLTHGTVVADVGSGTGISAKPLLESGNKVFCVEPNADMRAAAERLLGGYAGFRSVAGSWEETGLLDAAVDLVTCAQAFHWLDRAPAAIDFKRFVRTVGHVAII